LKTSSISLHI